MYKICPVCGATFECRHNDITRCQCASVRLTPSQRATIERQYGNRCLCAGCLRKFSQN